MDKADLRIVFMGTPEIAVASLQAILDGGYNVCGVITVPDKPAGRGRKIQYSAVKEFAIDKGLTLLQPENLKDPEFLQRLSSLNPSVQVVVAFRMLPRQVWTLPPHGTFNMHASLLPQYRGAAPINHAIINGETETGVTTFFLDQEIDTGKIIAQKKILIYPDDTAGTLHDRIMIAGAQLVIETLDGIVAGNLKTIDQTNLITPGTFLYPAPKIFRDNCRIEFNKPVDHIINFIRGLTPFPGAFAQFGHDGDEPFIIKIHEAIAVKHLHSFEPGILFTDNKKIIRIATPDGYVDVKKLQVPGKKVMKTDELLRGYAFPDTLKKDL